MLVIVILTVFDTSREVRNLFLQRTNGLAKEFKWDIKKQTYGIHRQASRSHQHITTVFNCGDGKVWKILTDKIKRSVSWRSFSGNEQHAKHMKQLEKELKVKITHKYSNEEGYDEAAALRYNFKEYGDDKTMWGDVMKLGEDSETIFGGVSKLEAEAMRLVANTQYEAVKDKRAKDEQDKLNKENKKLRLFDYIRTRETIDKTSGIHYMVQQVVCAILRFNKEENTNFRLSSLKDTAVNWLYQEGHITELEICEYIHI